MIIYISGIGGVAMGPIARIARDLGYTVIGTNDVQNQYTDSFLDESGITMHIGQTKEYIQEVHTKTPIDWFIYTSGLPPKHPELVYVKTQNIKHSKRDEFINHILSEQNMKMLAVSGTHGKTGTTGMLLWLCKKLSIPISYSIGTNISFGPNGAYNSESSYFVYEADEFDKNMLHFEPYASIITSLDYDHPDTYPSVDDYKEAFKEYISKSNCTFLWDEVLRYLELKSSPQIHAYDSSAALELIRLPGSFQRHNALLAIKLMEEVFDIDQKTLLNAINSYPGTERRLEKLQDNLYTDYAHHPQEIRATLDAALEINPSVVIVYQPHQNIRQHQVRHLYKEAFVGAKNIYWLPTYLSRDSHHDLKILSPKDLIKELINRADVVEAGLNNSLLKEIQRHQSEGSLVICMNAGNLDAWLRKHFTKKKTPNTSS